MVLADQMLRYH